MPRNFRAAGASLWINRPASESGMDDSSRDAMERAVGMLNTEYRILNEYRVAG